MTRLIHIVLLVTTSLVSFSSLAARMTCPDPQNSSLKNGIPPTPWSVNPFSSNAPNVDINTQFAKANILATGSKGLGVVCFYKNQAGLYSIWWQALVKIPAPQDYNWINTNGGFICTESFQSCQFSVAQLESNKKGSY
ncbi:MAG: DUF3757 domain-containing protein [Tatlockia sp.]|nr:DUF3757 domain-containing protein [Tatlockia sp.]